MDLSLVYFPSAVALGALHALEPGHAKTLTAAYLIGTKGTKRDAVLLGLSVAFTHSLVVIVLAVLGVWLGKEAFTDKAMESLQIASGVIVVLLGCWLLYRRWPRQRAFTSGGHHEHGHADGHAGHHHAPEPFRFNGERVAGMLAIVDTAEGERFRLVPSANTPLNGATVRIMRPHNHVEDHEFVRGEDGTWLGTKAPAEPHEFDALLELRSGDHRQEMAFRMTEPPGHDHAHGHDHTEGLDADEAAHARAHAATLPEYVRRGERPTAFQIVAFGAAGGLIPCPAAVTVMLLAVSVNRTGNGLIMVLGFSTGLAITLVGIGMAVVMGLNALGATGRFGWFSRRAGLISAAVVCVSGGAALAVALLGGHR